MAVDGSGTEEPERPLTAGAVAGPAPGDEDPVVVLGSGILGRTSFKRQTDRYGGCPPEGS